MPRGGERRQGDGMSATGWRASPGQFSLPSQAPAVLVPGLSCRTLSLLPVRSWWFHGSAMLFIPSSL